MQKCKIIEDGSLETNLSLLISILTPSIIDDFKFSEKGLHCRFKHDVSNIEQVIETYLSALQGLTDIQFYFEIENDREGILKSFSTKKIQFLQELYGQDNNIKDIIAFRMER